MKKTILNVTTALLALLIAALTAEASEICGNGTDDDGDNLQDEGCAPGLTTGVCESPLSCSETGWVSPLQGALHYQLPPDIAPKVPFGPGIGLRRFYTSQYAPALPLFQASGSAVSGTGTVAPAWPAHQANDVALLLVESSGTQPATLSNAQGFVAITGSPQGDNVDINGTVLTVFWKRATGSSEATPTVADSGDHTLAQIVTFRNVVTTGNPWDVTAGNATSGTSSTSFSIPGATTTVANTLVVGILATSLRTNSSGSNADLVGFNKRSGATTTFGNQGGLVVFSGTKVAPGTYGATSGSLAVSSRQARISLALRPADTAPAWKRPLGDRWQHTYMTWLTKTGTAPSSKLAIHTSRGQDLQAVYASAAGGWETYTPQTGYHFQYIRQRQAAPNEFEVKMLTGETLIYNSSGRLIEIWDSLVSPKTTGKVLLTYDGNSQVSTVTDASTQRRLLFGYTGNLLTTVSFQVKLSGVFSTYHTTTYGYTTNNLTSVSIGGQLAQTNVYASNYLTQIQDGDGRSIVAFDYNGTPGQIARIDARRGVLGYEYNSTRAACSAKTVLYFNLGNATSCNVDSDCGSGFLCGGKTGTGSTGRCFRGARCLTVSSPSEDVITTVTALGPPSESCDGACLQASSYVWNTGSGVLDLGAIQDPSGNYTVRSFNGNGLPTTILFGTTTSSPASTDFARQMFVTYDTTMQGRVATIRRQSDFGSTGATCTTSTGDCAQTTYTYSAGVLASMIQTGFTINASNTATAFSYTTTYTHDTNGRLTQIDGPLAGSDDVTTFTYYAASGLALYDNFLDEFKRKKDATNFLTSRAMTYDFWGNPTKLLEPDNTYTCLEFDAARGFLKKRTESMAGQSDCSVNAADIVTQWARDANLRLTKLTRPDGSCMIYEWDTKGRLDKTKRRDDCLAASAGEEQKFIYDAEGLVTEIQTYDSALGLTAKQPFTYFDSRRLARVVNPVNTSKWTGFTYEPRGLVSQVDAPANFGKTVFNRTGTAGRDGRVTSVDKYKTSSTFDTFNLLFAWLGEQLQVTDADTFATTTAVDDLGRVVRVTSADLDAPRVQLYDAASRLTSVIDSFGLTAQRTHTFTFDHTNRPLTADFAVGTSEGSCGGTTNPAEIERIYDTAPGTCPISGGCNRTTGRLAYVRVRLVCNSALSPDQSLDQETFYSYDDAGRMTREYIRDDAGRIAPSEYQWTKNGSLAGMYTPSGPTLQWSYGSATSNSDSDLVTAQSRNGTANPITDAIQWFPYGPLKQYNQQSTLSGVATRTRIARNLAYRPTGIYTETQTGGTTLQSTVLTEDEKGRVIGRDYTPNTLGVEDSYFKYDDQDRLLCETTTSVVSCPSTGAGIKNSHTASPPFTGSGIWKENRFSIGPTAYIRSFNTGLTLTNHRIRKVEENTSGFTTMQYFYTAKGERSYEVDDPTTTALRAHIFDQRGNRLATQGYYRSGGTWFGYSTVSGFDAQNRRVYHSFTKNDITSTLFYYYDPLNRVTEIRYTPNTAVPATYQVFQLLWLGDKLTAMYQIDLPSATLARRYVVADETNRPLEMWSWPTSGDTTRVWATNPNAYGFDANTLGPTLFQPVLFPGQIVDSETTAYRSDGTTVHRPALVYSGISTYDPFTGDALQGESTAARVVDSVSSGADAEGEVWGGYGCFVYYDVTQLEICLGGYDSWYDFFFGWHYTPVWGFPTGGGAPPGGGGPPGGEPPGTPPDQCSDSGRCLDQSPPPLGPFNPANAIEGVLNRIKRFFGFGDASPKWVCNFYCKIEPKASPGFTVLDTRVSGAGWTMIEACNVAHASCFDIGYAWAASAMQPMNAIMPINYCSVDTCGELTKARAIKMFTGP